MHSHNSGWKSNFFLFAIFGIFLAIVIRNSGLYPSVFADEYTYSTSSRLLPFSQSSISNYLYLAVYRLTNYCGDGFLTCSRLLNAIFFIAASPFIYQTARRVASKEISVLIVFISLVGPVNIYTAYFMPEAMYFFGFWVYVWYLLSLNTESRITQWALIGCIIGICSVIKPHGAFLLAPSIFYAWYLNRNDTNYSLLKLFKIILTICVGFLAAKMLIGFILAGKNGLSFFGRTYTDTTSDFLKSISNPDAASDQTKSYLNIDGKSSIGLSSTLLPQYLLLVVGFMRYWFINLGGHLLGLSLLFGLPIIAATRFLIAAKENFLTPNQKNLIVFSLVLLTTLIVLSSVYSGLMIQSTSEAGLFRLHQRYYNFAFPLLYMIIPCGMYLVEKNRISGLKKIISIIIPVLILSLIVWVLWVRIAPYQPTAIDSPELRGFVGHAKIFYSLGISSLIICAIWALYPKPFLLKVYFFIFLPLAVVAQSISVNKNISQRAIPDVYDHAGIVTRQLLNTEQLKRLVVVGDNPIELSRTRFYLDHAEVGLQTIKGGSTYELSQLPIDKSIALILNGHPVGKDFKNVMHFDGFSLVGGHGSMKMSFDILSWPPAEIAWERGLFIPPESWGTWSIAKRVELGFRGALPEQFVLEINCRTFGSNVGKDFIIRVGEQQIAFKGSDVFKRLRFEIKNPTRSNIIIIEVPNPHSPKSLGQGDDERQLGIAISDLSIEW